MGKSEVPTPLTAVSAGVTIAVVVEAVPRFLGS